jgi:hypothetical protein
VGQHTGIADRRHPCDGTVKVWIGRREFDSHREAVKDQFGMIVSKLDAHDARQDALHAVNQEAAADIRRLLVKIGLMIVSALCALALVLIKPYLHIP